MYQIPFAELEEKSIGELQAELEAGTLTSRRLVEMYQARIEALDWQGPGLKSVLELNPDALAIADDLDEERKSRGPRGPLHGIPILLKDNIATDDRMQTTAGSLALLGSKPPRDAFVARKLREAGAILLGKANLSEWANFRSTASSSGWSARGGQALNPYVLDRSPCGSSSGSASAIAANLAAASLGTETDGSILSPAATCGVVGIKPTVGLTSRAGVIPIAHSQDT
ncbi:MAG TPA: amidase family protein, partial [Ktedonobacteraceae bacterium]|nr:amidase family protein [Ktedonobacteraceae bacterium]